GAAVEHRQVRGQHERAVGQDAHRVRGHVGQVLGDVTPGDATVPALEDVPDTGARTLGPLAGEAVDREVDVVGVVRVDLEAGQVTVRHDSVDRQIQLVPAGSVGLAHRDAATEAGAVAPSAAPRGVDCAAGRGDGRRDVARAQVVDVGPVRGGPDRVALRLHGHVLAARDPCVRVL